MPTKGPIRLQEFVLNAEHLFDSHSYKEAPYHARYGVFSNVEAVIESALDRQDIEVVTPGIRKIYIRLCDVMRTTTPEGDLTDGVLQTWLHLSRRELDGAGSLLAQKHVVAREVATHVRALGRRWGFDPGALVDRLDACARAVELVEFAVPSRRILDASGQRHAQWAVRMSFTDTVIGARIVESGAAPASTVDLVRFSDAGYLFVAMFVSTIRWTGRHRLLLRSRPLTEIVYYPQRVTILLESGDGVAFSRVPAHRHPNGEWQQSEFRFEWRLDLADQGIGRLLRMG